jgi:16S rRNA (guanine527-N7)-methyltransferase
MKRTGPVTRNVSRETELRLEAFVAILKKWNRTINLISESTIPEIWRRHILDSAQLFSLRPEGEVTHWADLGSGGGFPGLVIAILALEQAPQMQVTLVESDSRKATFLREAARKVAVDVEIICDRAEAIEPLMADVLSARALAPLDRLVALAFRHLAPGGRALFPKGSGCDEEVRRALETWTFRVQKHQSISDPTGTILSIESISHV